MAKYKPKPFLPHPTSSLIDDAVEEITSVSKSKKKAVNKTGKKKTHLSYPYPIPDIGDDDFKIKTLDDMNI